VLLRPSRTSPSPYAESVAGQATVATGIDRFVGTAVARAFEPGHSGSIGGIAVPGFESEAVVEAVDAFEECVALEVGQDSPPAAHAESLVGLYHVSVTRLERGKFLECRLVVQHA
jgi:hypothetical protein